MPPLRTRNNSRTLDMEPTPQRPGLSIIAPTPRAISFPTTHALSIPYTLDAPSAVSPSSSPFEPDLSPVALRPHTPEFLSPIGEHSSPIRDRSRSRSPSRSPSRNGSRKLSVSSSTSGAPRKGDSNYIKRPENAFILFRRKCCEDRNMSASDLQSMDSKDKSKKPRQADLSKSISQQWKSLPTVERQYWEDLAKEKKKEHEEMYPGYVYRPQRARDKDGNVKPRRPRGSRQKEKAEKARLAAENAVMDETLLSPASPTPSPRGSLNIVIPAGLRQRSASLPNVSGNQILEIPLVYNSGGSCPASPSRGCAPGHEYVKGQSVSDEAVDWMAKGDGFMPWMPSGQFSWNQPQYYETHQGPSFFPINPDFSFAGANASDVMISPAMSSSSVSSQAASLSLPTPYLSYSQPPSCDPTSSFPPFSFDTDPSYNGMGLSPDTDLSSSLAHASLVWEQSNTVWGASSPLSQYEFGLDCLFSNQQQSQGWELGAVPPMELGLPTAHVDGESTPTEPISTLTL